MKKYGGSIVCCPLVDQ